MWIDVWTLSSHPHGPAGSRGAEGKSYSGALRMLILMALLQEIMTLDLRPWSLISFFLGHSGLSAKTLSLTNDPSKSQHTSPCPLRAPPPPPPPVPCSPEHPVQSLWGGGSKAVGQARGVALYHWVWFCILGQLLWTSVFPSAQ